jgi:hypothetical protein
MAINAKTGGFKPFDPVAKAAAGTPGRDLSMRLLFLYLAAAIAPAHAQENVGRVQQPIIAGLPVGTATQQARGLVTVSAVTGTINTPTGPVPLVGTCSGTLINRYWVLTADHCVAADGKRFGPDLAASAFTIGATWSVARPQPTQIVRVGRATGRDVALIFLGATDFGPAPVQELAQRAVTDESTILKYGQGISAYAQEGPPPVPAVSDGQYRQANMLVSDVDGDEYKVAMSGTGQQAVGGDSGGPDWVVAPGGRSLVWIAGVTSRCAAEYLDGMPENWNWVVEVGDECTSAGIWELRREILEIVEPASAAFCKDYATRAVVASQENARLMCGGGGPRWSSVQTEHLGWCIGNRMNSDLANEESRARATTLQVCLASRCDSYAALATAATKENLSKNCGGGGGRWTTDPSRHVQWCLGIRGDSAALNAENDARNASLQVCRDNLRLRRAAQTPAPPVGVDPARSSGNAARKMGGVSAISPEAFCASYSDRAVASANENIALNCGGTGGRWTTDRARHVNWCMGLNGDRTVPQAEAAARAEVLSACRAAQ